MSVSGIKIVKRDQDAEMLSRGILLVHSLKTQAEAAQKRYEDEQERFIKEMEALGRKTLTDGKTKVTVVERSLTRYDEKGLAKALGASLWNKITKKTLDKVKLEKAVDEGEIDINVVAQHASVVPSKAHLRFSAVLSD